MTKKFRCSSLQPCWPNTKKLNRPRFKFDAARIQSFLARVRGAAELAHPAMTLTISSHPSDNRVYECAEAAGADYLITGNTADFPEDRGPTRIITPRDFLNCVTPLLSGGEHSK